MNSEVPHLILSATFAFYFLLAFILFYNVYLEIDLSSFEQSFTIGSRQASDVKKQMCKESNSFKQ